MSPANNSDEVPDEATPEDELVSSKTRPQNVSRHTDRPVRRVTRFTLDLDQEQHRFLKLFALQNGIQASLVMRALLFMLETDKNLAHRVIDEIFAEDGAAEEVESS